MMPMPKGMTGTRIRGRVAPSVTIRYGKQQNPQTVAIGKQQQILTRTNEQATSTRDTTGR